MIYLLKNKFLVETLCKIQIYNVDNFIIIWLFPLTSLLKNQGVIINSDGTEITDSPLAYILDTKNSCKWHISESPS